MSENLSYFLTEFEEMSNFFQENKDKMNEEAFAEFRSGFSNLLLYYNV